MSCDYNYRAELPTLTALHCTDWLCTVAAGSPCLWLCWWAGLHFLIISYDHWGEQGLTVGYGCGDAWAGTVDNDYHPVTGTRLAVLHYTGSWAAPHHRHQSTSPHWERWETLPPGSHWLVGILFLVSSSTSSHYSRPPHPVFTWSVLGTVMIRASYTASCWDNYIHIVVSHHHLARNMSEKSVWPLTLHHCAYLISISKSVSVLRNKRYR